MSASQHLAITMNVMNRSARFGMLSVSCRAVLMVMLALMASASLVVAQDKLTHLSIEDLMELEISAVSKKPQKISDSSAAVFVITPEDIRRSGAASLPEVLRMVPGLHVAQVGADKWALSARGSNGLFANKLLVMIDGRTVYTPIFSGVFWNQQDTVLEDIARIEVVRGPGATLWGANAVNGVINIITRNASDSQGGLVTAGGGTETRGLAQARYGGQIGDTFYRLYSKVKDYDNTAPLAGGANIEDQWNVAQTGFRSDSKLSKDSHLTFQGDITGGDTRIDGTVPSLGTPFSQPLAETNGFHTFNLLSKWDTVISDGNDVSVQAYFDRARRDETILRDAVDTFDIEAQHNLRLSEDDQIIWGVGYRSMSDELTQTMPVLAFDPQKRIVDTFSGFVQNELLLLDDSVTLTFGSKFQHNDYTGFEVQPSARILWKASERQSVWAAFSRAVRTPSRAEIDSSVQLASGIEESTGLPFVYTARGNRKLDSEELLSYEIGYRTVVTKDLKFDLSTFYNQERSLIALSSSGEPILSDQSGTPFLLSPAQFDNSATLDTFGAEFVADLQVCRSWRTQLGYTFQGYSYRPYSADFGADYRGLERENPSHIASIRSLLNLSDDVDFDGMLRFVDSIPAYDVDAYLELDLRVGWRIIPGLELSLLGQNLLSNQHEEYASNFINFTPAQTQRGVFGKITWNFN